MPFDSVRFLFGLVRLGLYAVLCDGVRFDSFSVGAVRFDIQFTSGRVCMCVCVYGVVESSKEIAIDVVTYTSAICACGPDWALALEVLEDMAQDGVPPNLLSFTAAMGSCLKGEEYREAVAVFGRMKGAGIAPDLRAYNLAMIAHESDGNHYGRLIVEAEMQSADLMSQDREWETGWQPPADAAQGGFDEW